MKVWFELSAMALSRPSLLRRMVEVNAEWRRIIRDGIDNNRENWRVGELFVGDFEEFSSDALAALISVVLKGLYWENLQEFHEGHDDLMEAADVIFSAIGSGDVGVRRSRRDTSSSRSRARAGADMTGRRSNGSRALDTTRGHG